MSELLTAEEQLDRYCLQMCPGGCGETSACGEPPGHLHRHSHGVYDYSGNGDHRWERVLPNRRELSAFLKNHPAKVVIDGKSYIETDRIAEIIIHYLRSFKPVKTKRAVFGLRLKAAKKRNR